MKIRIRLARNVPKFFVFGADRITEAFEFVRAAFVRMEIRAFDMDAPKIGLKLPRRVLLRQRFKRSGHLFVRFCHDRGEHGSDAVLQMETEGDVVPFGIGCDEVMRFAAVVVNIDQARSENEALAIDLADIRGQLRGRFGNPDGGDAITLGKKRPFREKIWKGKAHIVKEERGRVRHKGSSAKVDQSFQIRNQPVAVKAGQPLDPAKGFFAREAFLSDLSKGLSSSEIFCGRLGTRTGLINR